MTPRFSVATMGNVLAICVVVTLHVFFGSDGTFEFRRVSQYAEPDSLRGYFGRGYYPSLAAGFLQGELSMAESPDPRLLTMENPYDPAERARAGVAPLWDSSYYRGKYYMYWSPLPALLVHIPFQFITGGYPSEGLAAVIFAAWGFVAALLFLRACFQRQATRTPLWIWILLVGIGNFVPFALVFARTYEVATLCGTAMSATWAYALIRFLEKQTRASSFWMGAWLGLAIAARPNLGVLIIPAAASILFVEPRKRRLLAVMVIIPLCLIGSGLLSYNAARFDDPFEFGTKYQITVLSMMDQKVCSLCTPADVARLLNNAMQYMAAPPGIWSTFPFAVAYDAQHDPATMFPAEQEQSGGVAPMIPITILGSIAAVIFGLMREEPSPHLRGSILVIAGSWLVMLGLSACWFIVARYTLDFALLMTLGAIVCVETALRRLAPLLRAPRVLDAVIIALAFVSILLGPLHGLEGKDGAFRKQNPAVYERLAKLFGSPRR